MKESNVQTKSDAPAPRVAAVVLNWNGGEINRKCLDSLLACDYPNLAILFVDNGSTDGSLEDIRERYPQIETLVNEENLGFTGGNNRGIDHALDAGAEMVLLLNNDVVVPEGFLQPLVDELKREGHGIVGPKVLEPSGKVWCAGGELAFHQNVSRLRGYGASDNGSFDRIEPVDYLPACCILISREVFERIGLLDEDYFCYLEDVEFCLRASRAGYPVTYFPDVKVCHYCSQSTGGGYSAARKYMNAVNSVRFLRKYGSLKGWLAFWLLDVFTLPFVYVYRLFRGQTRGAAAKFHGLLHGLAGRKISQESLDRFCKPKEKRR